MTKLIYPVYETVEESWTRFNEIFNLTVRIAAPYHGEPPRMGSIQECWEKTLLYWSEYRFLMKNIDFMFEAIYHIRYRVFSENVSTSDELRLVLLIEDELCRCGYAFHVWSNMEEFKSVYREMLFPVHSSRGWKPFCPAPLSLYLAGNMINRIMLKDRRPIDWGEELDCDRAASYLGSDYMRYRIKEYEDVITALVPEAYQWNEEWMDGTYAVDAIKRRYVVDYSKDEEGFSNLFRLVADKNYPTLCAGPLYMLGDIPHNLLNTLWGDRTEMMLKRCFLEIYKKYKRANKNKTKRSRYSQQTIVHSWLYQWVGQNRSKKKSLLDSKVATAHFNIGLGV